DVVAQALLVGVGAVLVLNVDVLVDQVTLGTVPSWREFVIALPIAMVAYVGIEAIASTASVAKDAATAVPGAIRRVVLAVGLIHLLLPLVALSALPVTDDPVHGPTTPLGLDEGRGGSAGEPMLGLVANLGLGDAEAPARILVGVLA